MINDFETIDVNEFNYSTPSKNSKGNYISHISLNDKEIVLNTPKMKLINGIKLSNERILLDLQFEKDHGKFYSFLNKLDENNILKISLNCKEWFDQDFPLDVIDDFYKSPITPGDSKVPPKLKLKIQDNDINVYSKNLKIDYSKVPENCYANLEIKLIGIKFFKQQVAIEWGVNQVNIYDDEFFSYQLKGKILNNNYSDDEYELNSNSNDQPKKVKLKKIKMNPKNNDFDNKLKDIDKLIAREFNKNKKKIKSKESKSSDSRPESTNKYKNTSESEVDKYKRINNEKEQEIINLKKQLGLFQ